MTRLRVKYLNQIQKSNVTSSLLYSRNLHLNFRHSKRHVVINLTKKLGVKELDQIYHFMYNNTNISIIRVFVIIRYI